MAGKKRKVRVAFQKNRQRRGRRGKLTREIVSDEVHPDEERAGERISGKGGLTRHRTILLDDEAGEEHHATRSVDAGDCLSGRVVVTAGLTSLVETGEAGRFECTLRRVLRTLVRQSRNTIVAGDRVLIRPVHHHNEAGLPQAVIERIETRQGVLARGHSQRKHIIAANVDQALIVASAAEPPLKRSLIDRFLISCALGRTRPLICVNKADLAEGGALEKVRREYGRLGYDVLTTSAKRGWGITELRSRLLENTTVVAGQSGVGKSSLLNAIDPELALRVGEVSSVSMKGRHTTRRAMLLPLAGGGSVIDTPGIRQFQLWDLVLAELDEFFVEFPRYTQACQFPSCTHTHEQACALKQAVALGMVSGDRYESYRRIREGLEAGNRDAKGARRGGAAPSG